MVDSRNHSNERDASGEAKARRENFVSTRNGGDSNYYGDVENKGDDVDKKLFFQLVFFQTRGGGGVTPNQTLIQNTDFQGPNLYDYSKTPTQRPVCLDDKTMHIKIILSCNSP